MGIQKKVCIFPTAFACMYDDYIGLVDTLTTDTLQSGGSVLSGIKWSSDSLSVCNQNAVSLKKKSARTQ